MSGSIKLKHASGNGVIISEPSSNPAADRTLTLPSDADGVIAKTDSSGNLTVAGHLAVASGSDTTKGARITGGASGGTDIADFRTNNGTVRMKINNDVEVVTGNLKIGTSGKGISFSETGDGAGSQSSELLADYEEGTFTPTLPNGGGTVTFTTFCAKYIKVGNVVHIFCDIGSIANHQNLDLRIGGFPYTSSSTNATTATLLTGRADPGDGLTINVFDSSAFCDVRSQFNSDGQKGQLFNGHGVHFNLTYLTN